jgi:hypothetical protein
MKHPEKAFSSPKNPDFGFSFTLNAMTPQQSAHPSAKNSTKNTFTYNATCQK